MLPSRSLAVLAAVAFLGTLPSVAHGQLNIMCSASAELCKLLADEFQKETGIKAIVNTRGRDALATIAEQKDRARSDVWFGDRPKCTTGQGSSVSSTRTHRRR